MTHENSAVQQITNNNLVVIALDSLSVTKLKEKMTSYLKGAYIYVGKQPFGFSLWCLFFTILVYRDSWDLHLCFNGFQKRI